MDASILQGWKAVADFLGVCIRTAQRWYKKSGLPLHHPAGQVCFAFKVELLEWIATNGFTKKEGEGHGK